MMKFWSSYKNINIDNKIEATEKNDPKILKTYYEGLFHYGYLTLRRLEVPISGIYKRLFFKGAFYQLVIWSKHSKEWNEPGF
jgi:hypothetical protein